MTQDPLLKSRKADHIKINLENDVQSGLTTGLENYQFIHQAIPEIDLESVDTGVDIFGKTLKSPILISSMTGGTTDAEKINQTLAQAAQETGIAMGLGSQRAMMEHPELARTFQVRKFAPDVLLFANLGAIQLNYGYTVDECRKAVDMVEADALILHFNPLQEALQPEGDTNFAGLLAKIEEVCGLIGVPVIAKEVGWGFSAQAAKQLANVGISAIDVAGAGGTSWSQVEMYRTKDPVLARVAGAFRDWGIPTADSIQDVKNGVPDMLVFASGGLRNGIEIAKCITLGANLGGMAGPFLQAATRSYEETVTAIRGVAREIKVCMFSSGARNISELKSLKLNYRPGR
jgi:isopentenyl-diphosphate Delta-isomerase